jgi:hypothetical protein
VLIEILYWSSWRIIRVQDTSLSPQLIAPLLSPDSSREGKSFQLMGIGVKRCIAQGLEARMKGGMCGLLPLDAKNQQSTGISPVDTQAEQAYGRSQVK